MSVEYHYGAGSYGVAPYGAPSYVDVTSGIVVNIHVAVAMMVNVSADIDTAFVVDGSPIAIRGARGNIMPILGIDAWAQQILLVQASMEFLFDVSGYASRTLNTSSEFDINVGVDPLDYYAGPYWKPVPVGDIDWIEA